MSENRNFENISKIDAKTIENLKKDGNAEKLINGLSQEQKQKLGSVLNDKKALEDILKSPQAIALMKMFGGDKNG